MHGDDKPYLFETVEFIKEQGHEHQLQISNLEVFTEYAVVVQAFNKIGQGKHNSVRKSSWPQNSHNSAELWSEFWSHYQFFTEYDEVVQAFNKIRQG